MFMTGYLYLNSLPLRSSKEADGRIIIILFICLLKSILFKFAGSWRNQKLSHPKSFLTQLYKDLRLQQIRRKEARIFHQYSNHITVWLESSLLTLYSSSIQHSHLVLFITQTLSSKTTMFTIRQEAYSSGRILIQENSFSCKDIQIILWLWIRMRIGLLRFSKAPNHLWGYGLTINVFLASSAHMKKCNKLDWVIKNTWLW